MNKVNGINELRYISLVTIIGNLQCYKKGESSFQKYYFPIQSLSESVNAIDDYVAEFIEEEGVTF